MIFILLNLIANNLFLSYSLSIMTALFYGIYLLQYCDRKHIRQRARLLGLKINELFKIKTNNYIFLIIYLDIIHGFIEGSLQMPSLEKVRKMKTCDIQTDPMILEPEIIERIVEVEKIVEKEVIVEKIIEKEIKETETNSFSLSKLSVENKPRNVKFSDVFEISSFTDQSLEDSEVSKQDRKSIFIKKKKKTNLDLDFTIPEETNISTSKKIKVNVKKNK